MFCAGSQLKSYPLKQLNSYPFKVVKFGLNWIMDTNKVCACLKDISDTMHNESSKRVQSR